MLEGDDILLLTNTQIGRNRRAIEKEFLIGGDNPYEIFTNSSASDARGVLIAIRIQANIQVVDMAKDDEDRILILKVVKGNETLTIGCVYDDNRNNTRTLTLSRLGVLINVDGWGGVFRTRITLKKISEFFRPLNQKFCPPILSP